MQTPTKRLIYFNLSILIFSALIGYIFIWYVGVILGVVLLSITNAGYFASKKQFNKLVAHNEDFRRTQEAKGNKILKLNQKEYDLLIKNKVLTKDGQTIYMEDMVNGNKEGK